ncbi:MAG: outer membrane protein assembly factor BamA, partial [Alphaproteobacteria bacterium]|nr:outer membrane protein assembly factor BamA [Alphaproteobacteria bacterium]
MKNKILLGMVFCCVLGTAYATKVSKIEYIGCKRIEQETIETYFPIQVGDDCDSDTINEALKALNKTGFFEDVNIEMKGSVLKVHVKEFPIINKISFEGNSKLSDRDIKKAAKLNSRETLSPAKIKEIQQVLLETYRKMGRYNASVNPKVIKLSDNRVNLVFEINEGDAAGIGKIVFVGNNQVSSSELRDVMYSKVKRWYRFFVNDDIYDADRMLEDKQAITKYYHDNGYADARVLSAVAELSPDKREFVLTFTIDEGDIYTLDNVSVNSRIPGVSGKELTEDLYCRQGDVYNEALIELDIKAISRAVSKSGFSAVRVSPQTVKNPSKKT